MGPPGSQRKEYALALAEYFSFGACISVGDLLSKEIAKKSELGRLIADSRKTYSYGKYTIFLSSPNSSNY
jgi:adenylate kinase